MYSHKNAAAPGFPNNPLAQVAPEQNFQPHALPFEYVWLAHRGLLEAVVGPPSGFLGQQNSILCLAMCTGTCSRVVGAVLWPFALLCIVANILLAFPQMGDPVMSVIGRWSKVLGGESRILCSAFRRGRAPTVRLYLPLKRGPHFPAPFDYFRTGVNNMDKRFVTGVALKGAKGARSSHTHEPVGWLGKGTCLKVGAHCF